MQHDEFHELCLLFPPATEQELQELRESIEQNGQVEKIILFEGKILDGRNRAAACAMLGIEPETIEYVGDDPLGIVLSKNLHRRHLTESQRAVIAAKLANMPVGRNWKNSNSANLPDNDFTPEKQGRNGQKLTKVETEISQSEAAKALNTSDRLVREAKKLIREAPAEVIEQVERGKKTVHAALKEIGQPVPGKDGKVRPAKYKPRKKTIAKTEEPTDFAEQYQDWHDIITGKKPMTWDWDGETPLPEQNEPGILKIPLPLHNEAMFAVISQLFSNNIVSEKVSRQVIKEIKVLAENIQFLIID